MSNSHKKNASKSSSAEQVGSVSTAASDGSQSSQLAAHSSASASAPADSLAAVQAALAAAPYQEGPIFRPPTTIPFDGKQYAGWSYQMQSLLDLGKMWPLIDPAASAAERAAAAALPGAASRIREAHYLLVSAVKDPDAQALLVGLPQDPHQVWVALERHYMRLTPAATASLKAQFWRRTQRSNENVQQFVDELKKMSYQLRAAKEPLSDRDMCSAFVNGLLPGLSHPVVAVMEVIGAAVGSEDLLKLEKLVEIARGEETRLALHRGGLSGQGTQRSQQTNALNAHMRNTHRYRGVKNAQREDNSGPQCFNCGEHGHVKANCPHLKDKTASAGQIHQGACPRPGHKGHLAKDCRQNGKASENKSGSAAPSGRAVISMHASVTTTAMKAQDTRADPSEDSQSKLAVLDSGAGRTIVPEHTRLLNGTAAPDTHITIANGETLSNPRRGEVLIDVSDKVSLHFSDALQHPAVDRPLVSVSAILASGKASSVVFTLDRADVIASDGHTVLFSAFNDNGVYLLRNGINNGAPDVAGEALMARTRAATRTSGAPDSSRSAPADAPRSGGAAPNPKPPSISGQQQVQGVPSHVLLHQRMSHCSYKLLRELVRAKCVRGLEDEKAPPEGTETSERCTGCALGKSHRLAFGRRTTAEATPRHVLQLVVADTFGPMPVESLGGKRYFTLLLDVFTSMLFVLFTETKEQIPHAVLVWCKQVTTKHRQAIVEFHSDGGGEFVNHVLAQYFESSGTKQTTTPSHTPQHNAQAEREGRTLLEWGSANLKHAGLPKSFWAAAVATAAYTRNRALLVPTAAGKLVTPFELWEGHAPSIEHMWVFGCDADVVHTVAPGKKLTKLSDKSHPCIFTGYDESKSPHAWLLWDAAAGRAVSSRDARFYEQSFAHACELRQREADAADSAEQHDDDEEWLTRMALDGETRLVINVSREEAEHEATQQANPANTQDAVEINEDSDNESASEEQDQSLRRSSRVRFEPNRYGMIGHNLAQARLVFALLAEKLSGQTLPAALPLTPRTYAEAVEHPQWQEAIRRELDAHRTSGTWSLTTLPPGRRAIGHKWVFRVKLAADGTIDKFKARLTAQGFSQREGVDYNETFAPVLHYTTLRLVLAIVAAEDLELWQIDVESAFLHAHVDEEIYMQVPAGVEAPVGSVCKLSKALYGIKQAPLQWHKAITTLLVDTLHYARSKFDECLFLRHSRTQHLLLIPLFVDDAFPVCHHDDQAEMRSDIALLEAKLKIKFNMQPQLILGMRVHRNRATRVLTLDQQAYLERLLSDYALSSCTPSPNPEAQRPSSAEAQARLAAEHSAEPLKGAQAVAYAALVGSLHYAALSTRPDISHAVNSLSRALQQPTVADYRAGLRVLRYIAGTLSHRLTLGGTLDHRVLCGYCDADWAGDHTDARSTTGWLVKIGSGPINWCSKKQTIVALSSAESEYIAAAHAAQELLWLRGLLTELGYPASRPTVLYCDNQSAIALVERGPGRASQRSKHINVRYHFIHQLALTGQLRLEWVSTTLQQADLLTKPLGPQLFTPLCALVLGGAGGHTASSTSTSADAVHKTTTALLQHSTPTLMLPM